jgi:hypothetical protein
VLCTNGHNCPDDVAFCPFCGVGTFQSRSNGQPAYAMMTPVRATNGLAVASLVLGIVWVYWVGSILALIFGLVARKQIKERAQGGDGMAIAGIVLGIVGIGVLAIVILLVAVAAHHTTAPY